MNFDRAADFIWKNGRLLERRIFEAAFLGGNKKGILRAVRAYQNDDGGFGHALEPDLRTSESQPLFTGFALRVLHDCDIRDTESATKVCGYVLQLADLHKGIPIILPSSGKYPRAEHWNNPLSVQPSLGRLTEMVGLLRWQGVEHPWLDLATDICLADIAVQRYEDAHVIAPAFCLLESLPQTDDIRELFGKLSGDLLQANFFNLQPSLNYGLTPLEFAPSPHSYCRAIFSDVTMGKHLEVLEKQQEEDGGWPIQWEPPGGTARQEWRAYRTVMSLITLKAYGMMTG